MVKLGFVAVAKSSREIQHLAGLEGLAAVRPHVDIPVVAIGGISRDNAPAVIDAGADAVAVISAVMADPDPALAAAELALLFNRRAPWPRGSVLTIAGSDSGGGAGIQADLKVVTLLGSYGASAITALTAQNTCGVTGIQAATPDFVAAQIKAVLADIPIDVVKTGMLFSAAIVTEVARLLEDFNRRILVVDPVMIAKGGANLIDDNAVAVLKERLLPLTYLLTPNIPEAVALTGMPISRRRDMAAAARSLHAMGARNILLKGGHLSGDSAADLFFDGAREQWLTAPRHDTVNTHGTGCSTASAVAAYLARGEPLPTAVNLAKTFISWAIQLSRPLGKGHGPVNHFAAARRTDAYNALLNLRTGRGYAN